MEEQANEKDAVDLCVEILSASYPKIAVTNEMPVEHPRKPYVMASRTGGDETPFLDRPIITFQCWDASDDAARRLAQGCVHTIAIAAEDHPTLSSATLISLARDEYSPGPYGSYSAQVKLIINR